MNSNKCLCSLILFTVLSLQNLVAGTWTSANSSSSNGIRKYLVYTPANLSKSHKAPLIVMLHGCDETANDFAGGTRIAEWAEKEKFVVLLPEQSTAYNPYRCWNWVVPTNNLRAGEPQAIISILDTVIDKYGIDKDNVFAAGMSAGASMVNILGNCYPERFKALASQDGTQYYATATGLDYSNVVLKGASVPSNIAAGTGFACSSFAYNKPNVMPIIIFHGMNSPMMSPVHAFQVEDEMKAFNDYLDNGMLDNSNFRSKKNINVPESKTYGYNLYTTTNRNNEVYIERYMIDKLGHSWSGGVGSFKYNDPKGPDATALIIKFFKRFGL